MCFFVSVLIAGCSNVKDANNSNFEKSLQDYLDSESPRCYFMMNFPSDNRSFLNNYRKNNKILDIMADLGIVRKKTENQNQSRPLVTYELTDKGKEFYMADARKNILGENLGGFCFGVPVVIEIDNFTEPQNATGVTISRVKYRYKVTGFPEWATTSELLELNDNLKKDVESEDKPIKDTASLLLTDKGWVHRELFNK